MTHHFFKIIIQIRSHNDTQGRFFLVTDLWGCAMTGMGLHFHKWLTIRKLMGGRGRRSTKKIYTQGKIKWKKNPCTPINPKKYSCYGLKKIHTGKIKIPAARKPPPPPAHNFSYGPFLRISRMGSHIFGILGLRIFFISRNLKDNEWIHCALYGWCLNR